MKRTTTAAGILWMTMAAFAQTEEKLVPELRVLLENDATVQSTGRRTPQNKADEAVDVIVVYKAKSAEGRQERMARYRSRLRSEINAEMAAYRLPLEELQGLATSDDVAEIHPDRELAASTYPASATVGVATARSLGFTGAGIGVAVLDSGFPSDDRYMVGTKSRIVYKQDFTGTGVEDVYGHSAHVMGIIGGDAKASDVGMTFRQDWRGLAPGVNFVLMKVLDDVGSGRDSNVIAAIDRAIALRSTYNIRVMNLSLGRPVTVSYRNDLLCQAVERAWKAGIVVVVSAGNFGRLNHSNNLGYGTITAPANDPFVITVGATRHMNTVDHRDDVLATYSSKGPSLIDWVAKPDLVAPGNQITSLTTAWDAPTTDLWSRFPATQIPQNVIFHGTETWADAWFFKLNGTSMAAPMVAGAAALMLQQDPTLTPDQVKARLMKTARKRNFPASVTVIDPVTKETFRVFHNLLSVGAGYLDVAAALGNRDKAAGNALSPTTRVVNGQIQMVLPTGSTFSIGTNVVWGSNVVWGENVVWGSNVVWGENVVWGSTSVLWGNATPTAVNVVWGESTQRTIGSFNVLIRGE